MIELLIKNYDCVNQPSVLQIAVSWFRAEAANVNFHSESNLILKKIKLVWIHNQIVLKEIYGHLIWLDVYPVGQARAR